MTFIVTTTGEVRALHHTESSEAGPTSWRSFRASRAGRVNSTSTYDRDRVYPTAAAAAVESVILADH